MLCQTPFSLTVPLMRRLVLKCAHFNRSSNSPESGISTSHLSIPDADFVDADGDFDDALPSLGSAKALYQFEGTLQIIIY